MSVSGSNSSQPTTPTTELRGDGDLNSFAQEKQDLLGGTNVSPAWIQTSISVVDQLKKTPTTPPTKYFHCDGAGDNNTHHKEYQPIDSNLSTALLQQRVNICDHCDQHLTAVAAAVSDKIIVHESASSINIRCNENHFCYIKTPHSIHCCNDCIEL